jgi:hypothetical protein
MLLLMKANHRFCKVVRGYLWNDTNCDGLRQSSEGAISHIQTMNLFYVGNDGNPFTTDDSMVAWGSGGTGYMTFIFSNGGGGNTYYIAIRPRDRPTGFVPSLWQQGTDRTIDNDMRLWPDGTWATGTFVIAAQTVTGIDIGLCPVATIARPYSAGLPLVMR